MAETWDPGAPGVMVLPSGRLVRGRGLRWPLPPGPEPIFALYLSGRRPAPTQVGAAMGPLLDFWLPADPAGSAEALREGWERAETEPVEIACRGGRGRTGTALACLVVLDGLPADDAVDYVRWHYNHRAVETPWRRRFIARLAR